MVKRMLRCYQCVLKPYSQKKNPTNPTSQIKPSSYANHRFFNQEMHADAVPHKIIEQLLTNIQKIRTPEFNMFRTQTIKHLVTAHTLKGQAMHVEATPQPIFVTTPIIYAANPTSHFWHFRTRIILTLISLPEKSIDPTLKMLGTATEIDLIKTSKYSKKLGWNVT